MGLDSRNSDSVYTDITRYRNFFFSAAVSSALAGTALACVGILQLFFFDMLHFSGILFAAEMAACAACAAAVYYTVAKLRQADRFVSYKLYIGDKNTVSLSDLARQCSRSEKQVLHDVRMMVNRKWFVQGYLHEDTRELFLTHAAWQARSQAHLPFMSEMAVNITKKDLSHYDDVSRRFLEQCYETLESLSRPEFRSLPFVMRQKLQFLHYLTADITHDIEDNPEHAAELERFAMLYAPTLVDVLNALHAGLTQRRHLSAAEEREYTSKLETLSSAFSDVLDVLFEDSDWSIDSDIAVYNTGLSQRT